MTLASWTQSEQIDALFSERPSGHLPPRDRESPPYGYTLHDFVKASGLHAQTEPKLIGAIR
jgi:hypothetical protein